MDASPEPTAPGASVSRRVALGLLGAAGAAALLTPGRRRTVPAGRVHLRYWEKWTGAEGEAVQRIVDRFNASQDRSWVERVPVAEIFSKAMVAIGGGDPPDVVGLFSWNVPYFAEARALMPFDDFPGGAELASGYYAPAIERLLQHEGRLWCGANTCYSLVLYANRARLAQVGLDAPPATIEELDAVSERLVERGADGRITRAGFLQNIPLWWPYVWPSLFGAELMEPGHGERPPRMSLASEGCRRAYQWVSDTAERHGRAASRSFGLSWERTMLSAADPFLSGGVAMTVQGPWMANFARQFTPNLDYVAAPVPVPAADLDPARPRGLLECDTIGIPRGCPHPEEAWEFVRFTQTRESQEELARAHCKPSPLATTSPDFLVGHPNPFVAVHEAVAKSPAVSVLPETRAWKATSDLMVQAFDAIWMGADVGTELERVQTRAQGLLEAARERYRARRERV
ncbi:extracellular solute-binding protein [Engelhardtia mirabilis]|uniref:extracellular solute-binding protein n=1 Tax=Engelhardtia mirabilis TaxID=2528011 RepID=UPI00119E8AE7